MIGIAILLGILEGATEFLPISSTGHLIVAGHALGFSGPSAVTFEIFIQLGAILAVVWEYRRHLGSVALAALRPARDPAAWRLARNLVIAFIPSGIAGYLLHGLIQEHLFGMVTVAAALIAGGIAMLGIEAARPAGGIGSVMDVSWKKALSIGFAQVLSLFPGVSRAAATIMGGMVSGLNRRTATEFSFYLAIPTMVAATTYDLWSSWDRLTFDDLAPFAVGFVVAFATALAAVRVFIRFVSHHDFRPFAWYRIAFGALILGYTFLF